jgi:hypothetical protein
MRRYTFPIVLLVGLAACAADSAKQVGREKYAAYPENIRKAIDKGAVLKGMTQEQVVLAVGRTGCTDTRTIGGKYYDSWTYHMDKYSGKLSDPGRCPADHAVIFEDGYVIEGETE